MSSTDYDVFLSHNSADKPAVEELARRLIKENIKTLAGQMESYPRRSMAKSS